MSDVLMMQVMIWTLGTYFLTSKMCFVTYLQLIDHITVVQHCVNGKTSVNGKW